MAIKFNPPLNWTTRIPGGLPSAEDEKEGTRTVRVRFTASMSDRDHAEVQRIGMRIELWTNAPAPDRGDSYAQDWRAFPFEETAASTKETEHSDELDGHDEPMLQLAPSSLNPAEDKGDSLPSPDSPAPSASRKLYVILSLPASTHRKYAFTYRLVKPSGIRWIGTEDTNGVLHIVPQDPCFSEVGEWKWATGNGVDLRSARHRSYTTAEGVHGDFVVGALDTVKTTWTGWSIAHDGLSVQNFSLPSRDAIPPSRLVYLIPKAEDESVHIPAPIVLQALSWLSPLSINADGAVVLHTRGQGVLARRVHTSSESAHRRLRSEIVSSSPAPEFLADSPNALVFTPHHNYNTSTTVYAQPLADDMGARLSLPASAFDAFDPDVQAFALFSPATQKCIFVDRPDSSRSRVSLISGNVASSFTICPAYNLSDDPRSVWQIATDVSVLPTLTRVQTLNPLPTPPPSPRPRPRQTVSFVLPLQEVQSPQELTPRGSVDATEQRDNVPTGKEESERPPDASPGSTTLAVIAGAQDMFVDRAHNALGDGRIFALVSLLTWLLTVFVRRLLPAVVPGFVLRRLDGLVWYLLPKSGSSQQIGRVRSSRSLGYPQQATSNGHGKIDAASREILTTGSSTSSVIQAGGHSDGSTQPHLAPSSLPSSSPPASASPESPPTPAFSPTRSESTKAVKWDLPPASHDGSTRAGKFYLFVRNTSGAAPHDILYVEVDGKELPLGPDLSGYSRIEEQDASKRTHFITSPTKTIGGVYEIDIDGRSEAPASVLVRLRT